MVITVYGPGCARCYETERVVRNVLAELQHDADLRKVTDYQAMASAGVLALFAPLGACPEVAEDTLEAYAIVAAMGPTYLWYQLYQLIDLGTEFGLTREAAAAAVAAMVDGASATMTATGMAPDEVMDLVPVKPLAAIEPTVREAYARTLGELHGKLKS